MSYQENYKIFLKSEYWKNVRKKVLARDNNKCQFCNSRSRLEVHHYSYKNHLDELNHLDDLVTLCKNCHSNIDEIINEQEQLDNEFRMWLYNKIMLD